MPTAPSRSSQPPHFQIHSAVYGRRNCTYRSKTIQNEVIKCFEQELRGIIISEVKQAKFFSVMADECSDVANKEQLAIVIRYVNEDDEICEDFVEFVECENGITDLALAEKKSKVLYKTSTVLI